MASDVAGMEAEVKEFKLQLETVQSSLQVDPDNSELQSLKTELEELISLTEQSIAEIRSSSSAVAAPASPRKSSGATSPPVKEKWSKEKHPAYQAGYRKPTVESAPEEASPPPPPPSQPPAPAASFSVNDRILARWVSGDNSFYPARITSITGSASNPMYIVSFKSYSTIETLTAKDIKPISSTDSRKRKADGLSGSSTPQTTSSQSNVISAAADINPALADQARQEPSNATDGPTRPSKAPRKVKANRELEAGKSKWQEFANKNKYGKATKKESMFRTPEGVNARVGFTGSGQQMRKDPTRTRHTYNQDDNEPF